MQSGYQLGREIKIITWRGSRSGGWDKEVPRLGVQSRWLGTRALTVMLLPNTYILSIPVEISKYKNLYSKLLFISQ